MKFIAFDVETTGTNILEDDVLQAAAIKFNEQGQVLNVFNQYAYTGKEEYVEAIRVHGLSKTKLLELNATSPFVAGKQLKTFLESGDGIIIGHNIIGFDLPLTWNWIKRNNDGNFVLPSIDVVHDTMMSARGLLCTRKWLKNSELAETLNIEFDSTKLHDALYDLEITMKNFLRMRNIDSIDINNAMQRLPEIIARRPAR